MEEIDLAFKVDSLHTGQCDAINSQSVQLTSGLQHPAPMSLDDQAAKQLVA